MEISFKAIDPLILVHGTNAQSTTWEPIVTDYLILRNIPFSNEVNFPDGGNGSIDGNAKILDTRIKEIARSFGAQSVSLIVHSKGGLDSRRFLSAYYRPDPSNGSPKVTSLYTITTPHHGCILSDLSIAYRGYNDARSSDEDVQLYFDKDWALERHGPQNPALKLQTTAYIAEFNRNNTFPRGINFYTIAADADLDNNGVISVLEADRVIHNNHPYVFNAAEMGTLWYNILGHVRSVSVERKQFLVNEWHVVTPMNHPDFLKNDLVVTRESSKHPASKELLFTKKNHSNVKNGTTIQKILNQIDSDNPVNQVVTK